MGLVSKRLSVAEPEHAKHVKRAKVSEALPELKQSAAKFGQLIESNKDRLNVQALNITHGSMASRTAEAIYRKNDLILIMTPEKQDKTLELSKHWSVDLNTGKK